MHAVNCMIFVSTVTCLSYQAIISLLVLLLLILMVDSLMTHGDQIRSLQKGGDKLIREIL